MSTFIFYQFNASRFQYWLLMFSNLKLHEFFSVVRWNRCIFFALCFFFLVLKMLHSSNPLSAVPLILVLVTGLYQNEGLHIYLQNSSQLPNTKWKFNTLYEMHLTVVCEDWHTLRNLPYPNKMQWIDHTLHAWISCHHPSAAFETNRRNDFILFLKN